MSRDNKSLGMFRLEGNAWCSSNWSYVWYWCQWYC
jgi:hypothetical protein